MTKMAKAAIASSKRAPLRLSLQHGVERITTRTGDKQQHCAARHRHGFPEVGGLVCNLCWLNGPIAQ